MIKNIHIIHHNWEDTIELNLSNSSLKRVNFPEEVGSFTIMKNVLKIDWKFWEVEYYFEHETIFYVVEKIYVKTVDWEEECYFDKLNKNIIRDDWIGHYEELGDEIFVDWIENTSSFVLEMLPVIKPDLQVHITNNSIPNIFHFVYGFKPQKEEFALYHYIAIWSSICINKPKKVYFYYKYEPFGYYWNKIKPFLTLEYTEPPTEIYGNQLKHYAHQSDIIRLQKLNQYGGVYLDIDMICLQSFSNLYHHDFVIGIQSNKNYDEIYGLCNAVLLSKPNSPFIQRWIEQYKTFQSQGRDMYWDKHSVIKPLEMAFLYPNECKIVDYNSFYYPLWYSIHDILFSNQIKNNEYKKILHNHCIHLWDTYTSEYLTTLTEEKILLENTLYNQLARKFISNKISIVMLTYNRYEKTIECLESYLKALDKEGIQELILFDNGSNENLCHYLKEFEKKHHKIKIIFHHENIGVCNGRINLFQEARGDIICSLDSDAKLKDSHFFDKIQDIMYDEKYGIIGISGANLKSWNFGDQEDIANDDNKDYYCDHIAGCCQIFRKELMNYGFGLDPYYGFFWCEDTDLSMQALQLGKVNFRFSGTNYIEHHWGGGGAAYHDLFKKNWEYLKNKWKDKVLHHIS